MLKKLASYAFLLGLSSVAHAAVTYDGHLALDANGNQTEYDVFFDITYTFDDRDIEGGKLGLGSDGTNQYMYIQHPLGFKDLSYGVPDVVGTTCDGDSTCLATIAAAKEKAVTDFAFYDNAEEEAEQAKDAAKKAKKKAKKDKNKADEAYYKALEDQAKADEKEAKELKEGVEEIADATIAAAIAAINGSEQYRVGWNSQDDGNTNLEKAVGSEYFELSFDGEDDVKFDLGVLTADNAITGDGNDISGFKSTLDYNRVLFGSNTGDLGAFEDHSPETIDCGSETSSDPSCYIVKNTVENRLGNTDVTSPVIDWDFNFGIEIQLSNTFFSNLQGITAGNFGYKDNTKLINLVGLHASDPKTMSSEKHGEEDCVSGSTHHHEPCAATVTINTPNEPVEVPEPSSIFMFTLGMVGLWLKRRKSHTV